MGFISICGDTDRGIKTVKSTQNDVIDAAKEEITQKFKAKARKDWPDDYTTQEFWVNEQINAYHSKVLI